MLRELYQTSVALDRNADELFNARSSSETPEHNQALSRQARELRKLAGTARAMLGLLLALRDATQASA